MFNISTYYIAHNNNTTTTSINFIYTAQDISGHFEIIEQGRGVTVYRRRRVRSFISFILFVKVMGVASVCVRKRVNYRFNGFEKNSAVMTL